MATITVWNKGKRTWPVKNAEGKDVQLNPQESVEMDEALGRRLCMGYPKDLTTSGIAGPSASDLARQEQSLRDRTANLDKREAALDEREKAIKAREDALDGDKPRRGRPARIVEIPNAPAREHPEASEAD